MLAQLNDYGDSVIKTISDHGCDIAIQRTDDLDEMAISFAEQLSQANMPVNVLEIGCGQGGQIKRMADAGTSLIIGLDIDNYEKEVFAATEKYANCKTVFIQSDMRHTEHWNLPETQLDIVISQRSIHYIKYSEAVLLLNQLKKYLSRDGRLFISASGINSELGSGYFDGWKDVVFRYGYLSQAMQEKHNIKHPVCLYSIEDMHALLEEAGYCVESIWQSDFGNVKAVARMLF